MPLSEREQRLLEEMERSLYRHDADFVATVSGRRGKPNYRWIVIGALLALAGLAVILVGIATQLPLVGVLGFAAILGGVLLALARPKLDDSTPLHPEPTRRSGFMDRMNERWERREDERGS